jgi:hypothetical protein
MMWRKSARLFCAVSLALCLAQPLPAQDSTSPSSEPVTTQLDRVLSQLQDLRALTISYNGIFEILLPQLRSLTDDSKTDSALSTQLMARLKSSTMDSQAVSDLSTTLSLKFETLSVSYKTAKLWNKIGLATEAVTALAFVAAVLTKGFTKF